MSENSLLILNWLLTTNPEPAPGNFESVVHWKKQYATELQAWSEPIDMAIAGGFLADCPAYAFAVGYWAALQRLLPDPTRDPVPALCISEKEGPHPAKIKCRLEKNGDCWRLNGKKHFVTCGQEADLLLVAASTGTDSDGKNRLRLVRVEKDQDGIAVKPLDNAIAILPEISHSVVKFANVAISDADILPGDGYLTYIKPFRTIEDLHVIAALLGYLLRIGTLFEWPSSAKEQLVVLVLAVRTTARDDFTSPAVHIATGGIIETLRSLLKQLEGHWDTVDPQTHQAWQRDRSVLDIATDARTKRLNAAWRHFTGRKTS